MFSIQTSYTNGERDLQICCTAVQCLRLSLPQFDLPKAVSVSGCLEHHVDGGDHWWALVIFCSICETWRCCWLDFIVRFLTMVLKCIILCLCKQCLPARKKVSSVLLQFEWFASSFLCLGLSAASAGQVLHASGTDFSVLPYADPCNNMGLFLLCVLWQSQLPVGSHLCGTVCSTEGDYGSSLDVSVSC